MATRTRKAPRPHARLLRRVLLATALACPLMAAPAAALPLAVNTPILSTTPTAGQTTTCTPSIVGLPVGASITISTGVWGSSTFSSSTSLVPTPKLITLADTAGGNMIFCEVSVKPPLLPAVSAATLARVAGIKPANKALPSVSGTTKVGRTVTCRPGSWSALPSSFSIKWLRDGSPVSKGRTRKLKSADGGHAIACSVVAHNPFGSSTAVTSPSRTVG